MPSTFPPVRTPDAPSSVTGKPETLCWRINCTARPTVSSGPSVIGSVMTPLADRFTFATSRACVSTERFLWMIPMPPSCASAIASADSVTVSIGAETSGTFSRIVRVSRVLVSASAGSTPERRGSSSTSSKVIPSPAIFPAHTDRPGEAADAGRGSAGVDADARPGPVAAPGEAERSEMVAME